MMKFKKMKSILAFSLPLIIAVLCVCTLSVKAAGAPPANLSVEYFGQSVANAGPAAAPVKRIPKFTVGDIVWIGVKADNLDKLALFKAGVYGMELGFDYNNKYLEPYGDLTAAELTALGVSVTNADSAAWLATINKFNFGTGLVNDTDKWNGDIYELNSIACNMQAESVTDANREDYVPVSGATAADYKMMFLSIQKKESASQGDATVNRFYNTADATGKYLIKLPMRVKAVPADPAPGWELKLSRGPQTFVVMSGTDGTSQYAQWEKATSAGNLDEHNLKTLFGFAKDLELFGVAAPDEIASLEVRNNDGNAVDTDDIIYDLHQGSFAGAVGFVDTVDEYYVRVPSKTDSVKLWMDSSSTPITVKYNDYVAAVATDVAITAPTDPAITWKTSAQAMAVVDTTKNTGFNNTLTLTVGETAKTYKIHVQRLAEAKIELNPGNSPYGMIQRDNVTFTTEEAKVAAKTAFNNSHATNKRFVAGSVPVGGDVNVKYTTQAWGEGTEKAYGEVLGVNEYVNYDKVDTAVFVTMSTNFVDPGFTVTDSLGATIEVNAQNTVTRKITADIMTKYGVLGFTDTVTVGQVDTTTITTPSTDNVITFTGSNRIKPGIYEIEYTFTDSLGAIVTAKRPLIVLSKLGDVNMDTFVNGNDGTAINKNLEILLPSDETVGSEKAGRLFKYRITDVNKDTFANNNDGTAVNKNLEIALVCFYTDLLV